MCRFTFIKNGCVMWDNSSVIDSVGKKIKDDRHFFVPRSKRSSEDTDKERFDHHEDYRTEAVAAGTRQIYLLSNVPTSPSTLFTSPQGVANARDTKGWIPHSIVGSMDLACRQEIYCGPSVATLGSLWRHLYPRDDPPISLLFVTRIEDRARA